MQYKVLSFKIEKESVSTGLFSSKDITEEDKLVVMEERINELAKEGWRVNQMSTTPKITGGVNCGGSSYSYYVVVIMEKE